MEEDAPAATGAASFSPRLPRGMGLSESESETGLGLVGFRADVDDMHMIVKRRS